MLLRAIALFGLAIILFFSSVYFFGETIIAWFWITVGYTKFYFLKLSKVWWVFLKKWIIKLGINFALVESPKRFFLKFVIPLLIGTAGRRWFRIKAESIKLILSSCLGRVKLWYADLHLSIKLLMFVVFIVAIVVLSFAIWWVGFALFLVRIPPWFGGIAYLLWLKIKFLLQKTIFRILLFFGVSNLFSKFAPDKWKRKWRSAQYRAARAAVRKRRMTIGQLHFKKKSWRVKVEVVKERLKMSVNNKVSGDKKETHEPAE